MALNLRNRIVGITLENDVVGSTNLLPYLGVGGYSRAKSQDAKPKIWQGEFHFFNPIGVTPKIELDNRKNDLWKKGGILKLQVQNINSGSTVQAVELVVMKYTVVQEGEQNNISRVEEIALSCTCYLGEMDGQGQSQIVNTTAQTAQQLATTVLELGAGTRSLTIDLSNVGTDLLLGQYTLNENQSAAGMAAEIAYPYRQWLWTKSDGTITSSAFPPFNDPPEPIQRYAYVDCDGYSRITPTQDLPTAGIAAGTQRVLVPDSFPRQSVQFINRPANTLYPNQGVGTQVIQAQEKDTLINTRGERTTKITKPLMSWGSLAAKTDPLTTAEVQSLKTQYQVTFIDGIKQYNGQRALVVEESSKRGIAGAFRTNYQDNIENIGPRYLTTVTLKTRREVQYSNGLPLFQRTETDYLADEDVNGSITESTATLDVLTDVLLEEWIETPIGSGLYSRNYQQVKRGISGEDLPAGPPQIELKPLFNEIADRLLTGSYEGDATNVNCGAPKIVSTTFDYASNQTQVDSIAQLLFERTIAEYYAIQINVPVEDWMLDPQELFYIVHVGEYAYRVERVALSWDNEFFMVATLELHEIGTLATPVEPREIPQSAWPPGLPTVFGPIANPPPCQGVPPVVTPPPTALQIDNIADICEATDIEINPVTLSAFGGTPPLTFTAPGGLPVGFSIVGNKIVGSSSVVVPIAPFVIRVTDSTLATSDGSVSIKIFDPEIPVPRVPLVINLTGGFAWGGEVQVLPYDTTPAAIAIEGGFGWGGAVAISAVPIALEGGFGWGGQVVVPSPFVDVEGGFGWGVEFSAVIDLDGGFGWGGEVTKGAFAYQLEGGFAWGGEVTKGAVGLTGGFGWGGEVDDGVLNPFEIEFNFNNGYPEFEL